MKKFIILLSTIIILFGISTSVFAGDVPEALGYEDDAQIFIGTLKDFDADSSELPKVMNATVLPTLKIKGDVPANQLQTYELCYFGKVSPEKETEYLFGWLGSNSVWVYAIDTYNEDGIKLKITDDFAKRIQQYLDDGLYFRSEQERSTIGTQISFYEFLYKKPSLSSSVIEKVTFRYRDNLYEIDKDTFFKIAEEIMVTNVKNGPLHDTVAKPKQPDPYMTNLYIELLDIKNQTMYFCAVSRLGEVDRYGIFSNRLMTKDYEMKPEDLLKLYSLLPQNVREEIEPPEGFPSNISSELPATPKKNYLAWIVSGVALFIIVFAGTFVIYKKNKK